MLTKLKKIIKFYGIATVASELGYRTPVTIYKWINNNKIPDGAILKVKNYIKQKGI